MNSVRDKAAQDIYCLSFFGQNPDGAQRSEGMMAAVKFVEFVNKLVMMVV